MSLAFERDPSVELNFGAFPQADAIYASGHAIRRKLVPGRFVGIRSGNFRRFTFSGFIRYLHRIPRPNEDEKEKENVSH